MSTRIDNWRKLQRMKRLGPEYMHVVLWGLLASLVCLGLLALWSAFAASQAPAVLVFWIFEPLLFVVQIIMLVLVVTKRSLGPQALRVLFNLFRTPVRVYPLLIAIVVVLSVPQAVRQHSGLPVLWAVAAAVFSVIRVPLYRYLRDRREVAMALDEEERASAERERAERRAQVTESLVEDYLRDGRYEEAIAELDSLIEELAQSSLGSSILTQRMRTERAQLHAEYQRAQASPQERDRLRRKRAETTPFSPSVELLLGVAAIVLLLSFTCAVVIGVVFIASGEWAPLGIGLVGGGCGLLAGFFALVRSLRRMKGTRRKM